MFITFAPFLSNTFDLFFCNFSTLADFFIFFLLCLSRFSFIFLICCLCLFQNNIITSDLALLKQLYVCHLSLTSIVCKRIVVMQKMTSVPFVISGVCVEIVDTITLLRTRIAGDLSQYHRDSQEGAVETLFTENSQTKLIYKGN